MNVWNSLHSCSKKVAFKCKINITANVYNRLCTVASPLKIVAVRQHLYITLYFHVFFFVFFFGTSNIELAILLLLYVDILITNDSLYMHPILQDPRYYASVDCTRCLRNNSCGIRVCKGHDSSGQSGNIIRHPIW